MHIAYYSKSRTTSGRVHRTCCYNGTQQQQQQQHNITYDACWLN